MLKRAKLTDLTIRALPEGVHFDERTPSFGIRVGKLRKTWFVVKGENRTKVRLGHYPQLSLHDARRRALVALGSPFEAQTTLTFAEALDLFLAQDRWKPRSKYVLEKSLRGYFHWMRPLTKITHEDVAQALDAIEAKSARSHALKDIRTLFNWCVPRYLSASPCAGLKMPSYVPRARVLTDDELRRVWEASFEIGYPFGHIVRLLILTGQRRSEIASLEWSHIDGNAITLPETKSGRAHTFPIGSLAQALIASVPHRSEYLFPARNAEGCFRGFGPAKGQMDKLKLDPWTLHDLRRTFATNLAALGTPIHVTEKLLNHVSGTTSGIIAVYQRHSYMPEMREAVGFWERRLAKILKQD